MAGFALAQAAAILVAALVLLRRDEAQPIQVAAAISRLDLDVEPGEQAVVRLDKSYRSRVEKLKSPDDVSSSLPADTPHDEIGEVEAADFSFGTVAVQ